MPTCLVHGWWLCQMQVNVQPTDWADIRQELDTEQNEHFYRGDSLAND